MWSSYFHTLAGSLDHYWACVLCERYRYVTIQIASCLVLRTIDNHPACKAIQATNIPTAAVAGIALQAAHCFTCHKPLSRKSRSHMDVCVSAEEGGRNFKSECRAVKTKPAVGCHAWCPERPVRTCYLSGVQMIKPQKRQPVFMKVGSEGGIGLLQIWEHALKNCYNLFKPLLPSLLQKTFKIG